MEIENISWYLGVFLVVSGVLSFIPVPVALYYHEPVFLLLVRTVGFILLGFFFMKHQRKELDFRNAMLLIAMSMVFIPVIGAIPFYSIMGGNPVESFVDGYFESISGYTTSGLSLLPEYKLNRDLPGYSHSLIFSRTLMEWSGGLGVVVIFLSLLAKGGISTVLLYRVEGGKRIVPSIDHTTRIILKIYLFYTSVGAILLWILGMEPVYALSTIMSTLSTGGFISLVSGLSHVPLENLIVCSFLILAATPFTVSYSFFSGEVKNVLNHVELRFFAKLFFMSLILFTVVSFGSCMSFIDALGRNVILIISALTTGGYSLDILEGLRESELFILVLLMLIGGGAGSTAGGIKIIRFGILINAIRWYVRKLSLPESAIFPLKIKGNVFSDEEIRNVALFFFIYVLLILIGVFVIMVWGVSQEGSVTLDDAFILSVSAQGNVGYSIIDLKAQPILVKLMLIFQMVAGRLEIFPVLAFVGYIINGFQYDVIELEKGLIESEKKALRSSRTKLPPKLEDELEMLRKIMRIGDDD